VELTQPAHEGNGLRSAKQNHQFGRWLNSIEHIGIACQSAYSWLVWRQHKESATTVSARLFWESKPQSAFTLA